jgi:sugar transferase (PEP-CTERM/EpsH1 system associated)
MPKKIVHVVHSLDVGGLENGLVNLLNRLDSQHFEQTVCCLTTAGKFAARIKSSNIQLMELHLPTHGFRMPLLRLTRIFQKLSPDIVHTRGWPTVDAIFAARFSGVPRLIHGEHGREHTDPDGVNWKRNQIRRAIGRIVDRYVIVCDFFRSWLRNACKVRDEKITYIPNGVDTEAFSPLDMNVSHPTYDVPSMRMKLRQKLELPSNTLLVGTVGRLDPVKDIPTLIKAFKNALPDCPDAKLVIVGGGPLQPSLIRLGEELGIETSLLWLGERGDIPEILRCLDVFVQISVFEGMSNTVLEAMASGLPIIATRTGGNPELVNPGQNGMLVSVGNVQELSQTLRRYLADAALRKREAINSRRRAVECFDLSVMVARYAELYESLA